ncbi:YhcN/YlaJ family sporulation lipoprotein [Sutcliffiella halmapala]
MNIKGFFVTGLAFTLLATGCGNVDDYGAANRNAPNDSLNVNYEQMGRYNRPDNVRNNINPRRVNDENEPRMAIADRAADNVTDLKEVETCNVIVTDDNAYVAAVLDNGKDELSQDVERKIADQVRKADPDIDDVFVSVNPDFIDRMDGYANDLRSGRPVRGMLDEFTETVQRIFPTNR